MKPIALLYTGGTIGARVTDGAADAAPGGGRLLTEVFRRRHPDSPAVFDEREPLTTLSENMTVEKWNTLLDALRDLEPDSFAGVIPPTAPTPWPIRPTCWPSRWRGRPCR